jgi:hypothetical protein
LAAAVAGLMGLAGLAGCSVIQANRDTALAIDRAGFRNANVSVNSVNGNETVNVSADVTASDVSQSDGDKAAQVVWTTFRYRIDDLNVDLFAPTGEVARTYGRSELETMFGPRNRSYDKQTVGSAFVSLGKRVALGVAIGGLLFLVFVVVVIVLLVRSSRRRRAAAPQPAWGGPAYGYDYRAGYWPPPAGPWASPPAPGPWTGPPPAYGPSGQDDAPPPSAPP